MGFFVKWENINVGILLFKEGRVKYKILFENITDAETKGLDFKSIISETYDDTLPLWIKKRIPEGEETLAYLNRTGGYMPQDKISFVAV